MNHREIVHSHIDPILTTYETSVDELLGSWKGLSFERKIELGECMNHCLNRGRTTVKCYFLTMINEHHLNTRLSKWSY